MAERFSRMTALRARIKQVIEDKWWRSSTKDIDELVDAFMAALQPELGELEATKMLLEETQKLHAATIADFCALRDALPREQVKQILGWTEVG